MLSRLPKSTLVVLAFACVYFFWGSTYTATRIAGEHLPVPVVSASRTLISSSLIVLICLLRKKSLRVPKGEWWKLAVIGLLFMSCNNMLLTWGEKLVPSGFASLIVSTMPIMVALIEVALPGGDVLNKRGWAGTILGTLGIIVLVWPSLHAGAAHSGAGAAYSRPLLGVLVLLGAALAFAISSVLSRRFHFTADAFVATGWQLGAAAIFNSIVAVASGGVQRAVWTWTGFGSIVYLAIFGSLVGLFAITYLLQHVAVTKVSTCAFVNPVIAVLLGVLLLHEQLAKTEIAGMVVIVCAVAIVVYSRMDREKREIMNMAGEAGE